jgi:hypothetical protein
MSNGARQELRRAQAAHAAAEQALEGARAASERSREFLESTVRRIEAHEAAAIRASSSLVEEMKAAIASGGAPSADEREMAKIDVARTALDGRRQAAERVVADLAAEEREREREVSNATAAVATAVQDVLRVEVEALVAKWEQADAAARVLRVRLGVGGDPAWDAAGKSDAGRRATFQNFRDSEFELREQQAARAPWLNFSSALRSDPNARLDFGAADLALEAMRKERADRRAADEAFLERMKLGPVVGMVGYIETDAA